MSEILVNTIKKADGTGSITVPADTGTVLTTATTASSIPGYGNVAEADQWRVVSTVTGNGFIGDVWERSDTSGMNYIGTGMSSSNGVFTFPSTGIWHIHFEFGYVHTTSTRYANVGIYGTLNNSTYAELAYAQESISHVTSNTYSRGATGLLFDVTDTSLCKIKFYKGSDDSSAGLVGSTTANGSYATFIRLGDT